MNKIFKSLGWGFLFCIVAFVLAEVFFRCLFPRTNPFDDRIAQRYVTPYTMFSKFEYGAKEKPKGKAEIRIFMLGGSTVAYGHPPLPVCVEQELKKRGWRNVRVFNYGVISQNSGQELAHLIYHVIDSEPDLVVFYDGGNDIMDPLLYDPRPGYPFNFLAYENNVFFKEVDEYPAFSLLAYGSEMCRRLFRNYFFEKFGHFSEWRSYVGYGTYAWSDRIAQIYAGNLAKAARICGAYGVAYAAFSQPLLFDKREWSETEMKILDRWPKMEKEMVGPYVRDVRDRITRCVAGEQKAYPFYFHDLSGVFREARESIFIDYIHITGEANQKIASVICDRLMGQMQTLSEKRKTH